MARQPKRIQPAEDAFGSLKGELEALEAKLDDAHEIATRISGGSSLIHVQTMRIDPPDALIFEGSPRRATRRWRSSTSCS